MLALPLLSFLPPVINKQIFIISSTYRARCLWLLLLDSPSAAFRLHSSGFAIDHSISPRRILALLQPIGCLHRIGFLIYQSVSQIVLALQLSIDSLHCIGSPRQPSWSCLASVVILTQSDFAQPWVKPLGLLQ